MAINKFQDAFYKTEDILTLKVWSFPIPEVSSHEWCVNDLNSGKNFWPCLFFANQANKDTGAELQVNCLLATWILKLLKTALGFRDAHRNSALDSYLQLSFLLRGVTEPA